MGLILYPIYCRTKHLIQVLESDGIELSEEKLRHVEASREAIALLETVKPEYKARYEGEWND